MDKENALKHATNMLEKKNLNAVCLNILGEKNAFGSNQNEVSFITSTHVEKLLLASKFEIAQTIVELSASL